MCEKCDAMAHQSVEEVMAHFDEIVKETVATNTTRLDLKIHPLIRRTMEVFAREIGVPVEVQCQCGCEKWARGRDCVEIAAHHVTQAAFSFVKGGIDAQCNGESREEAEASCRGDAPSNMNPEMMQCHIDAMLVGYDDSYEFPDDYIPDEEENPLALLAELIMGRGAMGGRMSRPKIATLTAEDAEGKTLMDILREIDGEDLKRNGPIVH